MHFGLTAFEKCYTFLFFIYIYTVGGLGLVSEVEWAQKKSQFLYICIYILLFFLIYKDI